MNFFLDKSDTRLLKGIAITLIILHNYFHVIYINNPGENEFSFIYSRTEGFLSQLFSMPSDFTRILFSFWGHYGVPIFIFLSVYGISIAHKNTPPLLFIKSAIIKLFPAIIISILIFTIYSTYLNDNFLHIYWKNILLKLSLLANFYPYQALSLVGPWWFISFIFQLYLFFIALRLIYKNNNVNYLIIISIIGLLLEYSTADFWKRYGLNINYTILGYIPLISFSMFIANNNSIEFKLRYFILALVVFFLSNFHEVAWLFSGLAFLIITLWLYFKYIKQYINKYDFVNISLDYLGKNSLYLFLLNGFVRSQFVSLARNTDNIAYIILFGVISFITLLLAAEMAKKMEELLLSSVKKVVAATFG